MKTFRYLRKTCVVVIKKKESAITYSRLKLNECVDISHFIAYLLEVTLEAGEQVT